MNNASKYANPVWFQKPVFGWPILLACFAGMSGNVGPLVYASFAFIIRELESEFGWSRSSMTLSISLLTLTSAAIHPLYGRLVDRYGVRRTLLPSLLMMAGILATVPLYLSQIWHLWLAFILVAILGVANNNLPFIRLIATWFDKRRGLMLGFVASGTGVGLAVLPKATALAVSHYGWQGGFVFYGLFIVFVTVPIMYLLVRDTPESVGLRPDGIGEPEENTPQTDTSGLNLSEALQTRGFWLLFIGVLFASFALWGITNQMGLVLIDRGFTPSLAASVAVSLGLSMAAARLIIGYLLDKVFAPVVGGVIFLLSAMGFMLLAYVPTPWAPFVAASLLGAGLGAETELMGYMVSRYFGLRQFGTIYSLVFVGFLLGTSGGPYMYAKSQEILGSYDPALQCMILLMLATAAMFASMGKYDRYREKFAQA
jgi:sugar phosphate permease